MIANLEAPADLDADILVVGGSYHFAAISTQLAARSDFEKPTATPGTVVQIGHVVFVGGVPRTVADLDRDGVLDVILNDLSLPAGIAQYPAVSSSSAVSSRSSAISTAISKTS